MAHLSGSWPAKDRSYGDIQGCSADDASGEVRPDVEDNLFAFCRMVGELKEGESRRTCGVSVAHSGTAILNRAFAAALHGPVEEAVRQVDAFFDQKAAKYSWLVSPGDCPLDLSAQLEQLGFRCVEEWLGMSLRLPVEEWLGPSELPLDLTEAADQAELETWCSILSAEIPESRAQSRVQLKQVFTGLKRVYRSQLRYVFGTHLGEPLCCGMVLLAPPVAGLYWIATKPDARRRGFARQLTHRLIRISQQEGCHEVVLQASGMGEPLYRQLGFRPVGGFKVYRRVSTG